MLFLWTCWFIICFWLFLDSKENYSPKILFCKSLTLSESEDELFPIQEKNQAIVLKLPKFIHDLLVESNP